MSGAQDAAALPAFDVDEGASTRAGEGERFYIELGDAPVRGPADAPVTIVMFSDFECPFCRHGHEAMEVLRKRYPKRVRIAYKAYPLDMHSNALVAAMAARSAQTQGKFWEFHDRLFSEGGIESEQLVAYAKEVGLDFDTMVRDIESLEYGPEVRRDIRQARRLGVHSTPTFFVNGRQLSGAKPIEEFVEMVDRELEQAEKWRKQGVPSDQIYAHAIKDGYRKVAYTEGRGLDPDGVFPVPIGDSPTLGPKTAPVTIVVFGDFECRFCVRGFEILKSLEEHYADKLRLVYKHNPLPFHSHAYLAARASMAAHAQGKFWAYHDALYATDAQFDENDLLAIAKRLGLQMNQFVKAMNSTALDDRIERDLALGAAVGVTGTPAFFINGRPLEGAMPQLQFRLLIEEELERAEHARASGVPPDKLYDTLSHQPLDPF
jgi:protein-disulfide isomerase